MVTGIVMHGFLRPQWRKYVVRDEMMERTMRQDTENCRIKAIAIDLTKRSLRIYVTDQSGKAMINLK